MPPYILIAQCQGTGNKALWALKFKCLAQQGGQRDLFNWNELTIRLSSTGKAGAHPVVSEALLGDSSNRFLYLAQCWHPYSILYPWRFFILDQEKYKATYETRFLKKIFSNKEEIEIVHVCHCLLLFCFVSPYDLGDVPNTCIYLNTIIFSIFQGHGCIYSAKLSSLKGIN